MVNRIKHVTLDNAKQFFFENRCMYQLMDWNLHDQFMNLDIPKEKIYEWINEYYFERFNYFQTLKSKSAFIYDMQYNFSEVI